MLTNSPIDESFMLLFFCWMSSHKKLSLLVFVKWGTIKWLTWQNSMLTTQHTSLKRLRWAFLSLYNKYSVLILLLKFFSLLTRMPTDPQIVVNTYWNCLREFYFLKSCSVFLKFYIRTMLQENGGLACKEGILRCGIF